MTSILEGTQDGIEAERSNWMEFCANEIMDATLWIKLLAVCEGRQAESLILWDLIQSCRQLSGVQGAEVALHNFFQRSANYYMRQYPAMKILVSERSLARANLMLAEKKFIANKPVHRKVSAQIRIEWRQVATALEGVDSGLPGLRFVQECDK